VANQKTDPSESHIDDGLSGRIIEVFAMLMSSDHEKLIGNCFSAPPGYRPGLVLKSHLAAADKDKTAFR
jgi:hypothetical protein